MDEEALTLQLSAIFGDALKEHEPMARHTNFRLGGPARWFAPVSDAGELTRALDECDRLRAPWFVMGGGSNTLVADEGFAGAVLQMAMREQRIEGTRVVAGAGALMVGLARATAEAGLAGLEWAISLPGTVGGAVRGNAGCYGGETKDCLVSATVLRGNKVLELSSAALAFAYRDSSIKRSRDVVLSATFELEPGDRDALKARMADILSKRKSSQPLYAGSAGCLFKNADLTEAELQRVATSIDIPPEMIASRRISAGWLIDKAALKGASEGGAQVSPEHGNFVINAGNATAKDVRTLATRIKRDVLERFGIELHEEVQYLGFEDHP